MEHRQEESVLLDEKELLRCCGSTKFAKEMASASPFSSFDQAVSAARHIWFNLVCHHTNHFPLFTNSNFNNLINYRLMSTAGLKHFRLILRSANLLLLSYILFSFSLLRDLNSFQLFILYLFLGRWSKAEQSTALATSTESSLQVSQISSLFPVQLSLLNESLFLP